MLRKNIILGILLLVVPLHFFGQRKAEFNVSGSVICLDKTLNEMGIGGLTISLHSKENVLSKPEVLAVTDPWGYFSFYARLHTKRHYHGFIKNKDTILKTFKFFASNPPKAGLRLSFCPPESEDELSLIVKTKSPNLKGRRDHNVTAEFVSNIPSGSTCRIIDQQEVGDPFYEPVGEDSIRILIGDAWYHVSHNEEEAWIYGYYTSLRKGQGIVKKVQDIKIKLKKDMHVRTNPNREATILGIIKQDHTILVESARFTNDESKNSNFFWFEIEYVGKVGWINGRNDNVEIIVN